MAFLLGTWLAAATSVWLALGASGAAAVPVRVVPVEERLAKAADALGRTTPVRALCAWEPAAEVCRAALDSGRIPSAAPERIRGAYAAACVAAGLVPAVLLWSPMAYLLGAPLSAAATIAARNRVRAEKDAALEREVPDVLRTMATGIGSGQTLSQAISYVGSRDTGPVSREFARAGFALSCGSAVPDVLEDIGRRLDSDGVGMLVMALEVSRKTGAPLEGLLMKTASLVEAQTALRQTLSAKTAQVRLSARVVMTLPAILVGCLALISSDFRGGLATPAGLLSIAIAAGLDAVALLAMKALMKQVGL
jgi:tight adherence protein B